MSLVDKAFNFLCFMSLELNTIVTCDSPFGPVLTLRSLWDPKFVDMINLLFSELNQC